MFRHDLDPVTAAYHEAGHVLIAHLLGGRVVFASIEAGDECGGTMGETRVEWPHHDESERQRCSAQVALAGPLAESRWRGDVGVPADHSSWRQDWAEVRVALDAAAEPAAHARLLRHWMGQVQAQLADPGIWECLCRIADTLEAYGSLEDTQLEELL